MHFQTDAPATPGMLSYGVESALSSDEGAHRLASLQRTCPRGMLHHNSLLRARARAHFFHAFEPGITTLQPSCAQISWSPIFINILPPRYQPAEPLAKVRGSPRSVLPSTSISSALAVSRNFLIDIFIVSCTFLMFCAGRVHALR